MKFTIEQIQQVLESRKATATKTLKEFAERVTGDNPLYAMTWSSDAFQAAAAITVLASVERTVDYMVENGVTDETVGNAISHLDEMSRGALIKVASLSRSTSATSNLSDTAEASQWADLWVEEFGNSFKRLFLRLLES